MEVPTLAWYACIIITVLYAGLLVCSVLSFRKEFKELKAINEEAKKSLFSAKELLNSMIADEALFKEFIGWKIIHGHLSDTHIRVDH